MTNKISVGVHGFKSIDAEAFNSAGFSWVNINIHQDSGQTFELTLYGPEGHCHALATCVNNEFNPAEA